MGGGRGAPERCRGTAEETAEARGKVAVAGKSGVERDGREVAAAIEHGVQRMRQPLMQHVFVDRGPDHLAKHMAEMERRKVRNCCQLCDAPFVGRRYSNG